MTTTSPALTPATILDYAAWVGSLDERATRRAYKAAQMADYTAMRSAGVGNATPEKDLVELSRGYQMAHGNPNHLDGHNGANERIAREGAGQRLAIEGAYRLLAQRYVARRELTEVEARQVPQFAALAGIDLPTWQRALDLVMTGLP